MTVSLRLIRRDCRNGESGEHGGLRRGPGRLLGVLRTANGHFCGCREIAVQLLGDKLADDLTDDPLDRLA
jgi:hypothetical protein